jgi:hypothetical protein
MIDFESSGTRSSNFVNAMDFYYKGQNFTKLCTATVLISTCGLFVNFACGLSYAGLFVINQESDL